MRSNKLSGHMAAIFSVLVWGVTFISTKILLFDLGPLEILFHRFLIGWLALWALCPVWLPFKDYKKELLFALAGLCGVTLYFLLENMALLWTLTSNASVIVSTAPFFTAILSWKLIGDAKPAWNFYAGFVLAISGIGMISFNGQMLEINPLGDGLALLAAVSWGFYSVITRKLAESALGALVITRRIFFYGVLFILPALFFFPLESGWNELLAPRNLVNLLFLGLLASALCFVTWTFALARIGTGPASAYIYLVPVITIICAAVVLGEPVTPLIVIGCCLTIMGLLLSENWIMALFCRYRKKFTAFYSL